VVWEIVTQAEALNSTLAGEKKRQMEAMRERMKRRREGKEKCLKEKQQVRCKLDLFLFWSNC